MSRATRVLVVDDAAFFRRALRRLLVGEQGVVVVGEAVNGMDAIDRVRELRPDVVCLDIDMPVADGVTAMKHIMTDRPTPVIIVSSMTDRSNIPFEVLRLGAVDFFPKPSSLVGDLSQQTRQLRYLVRNAHSFRGECIRRVQCVPVGGGAEEPCTQLLVVAGTLGSAGPLLHVMAGVPPTPGAGLALLFRIPLHPAIVASFLRSVEDMFGWKTIAVDGRQQLCGGHAYFASSEGGIELARDHVSVGRGAASLDALFAAAAGAFGDDATTILLAGDQHDGMDGLRVAAEAGASCYLQDETTALFSTWSPAAVEEVACVPLDHIIHTVSARLLGNPEGTRT